MAQYRTSMRLGVLNLLILIVAVSLAVLGVLSLVTAQANVRLSERQAVATKDVYVVESAGQYFLQDLDYRLDAVRGKAFSESALMIVLGDYAQYMAKDAAFIASESEIEVEGEATALTLSAVYTEMGVTAEDLLKASAQASASLADSESVAWVSDPVTEIDVASEADDDGIIHRDVIILKKIEPSDFSPLPADTSKAEYVADLRSCLQDCIGGISADFSLGSGRNLHCVIAIDSDLTYKVLAWKATKSWVEEAQGENHWLG